MRHAPGRGTCFDIYMPRSDVAAPPAPALQPQPNNVVPPPAHVQEATILLVDDEEVIRRLGSAICSASATASCLPPTARKRWIVSATSATASTW